MIAFAVVAHHEGTEIPEMTWGLRHASEQWEAKNLLDLLLRANSSIQRFGEERESEPQNAPEQAPEQQATPGPRANFRGAFGRL